MSDLRWAYDSDVAKEKAFAPTSLRMDYGMRRQKKENNLPRAVAIGRRVHPYDCGPIGLISKYGFSVRCPGKVSFQRNPFPERERIFAHDYSAFGDAVVSGDGWPQSDSERVVSWVSGSEYVKIQTGIIVFFPIGTYLYQGPLPNANLLDLKFETMAGVEYGNASRNCSIDGVNYHWTSLTVIMKLPAIGEIVEIDRGEEVAWFFPVLRPSGLSLLKVEANQVVF